MINLMMTSCTTEKPETPANAHVPAELYDGLGARHATISPKFLYDALGSKLFTQRYLKFIGRFEELHKL